MAGKNVNISFQLWQLLFSEMRLNVLVFQAKVGREGEFQAALQKLRGKDTDVTREAEEIQVVFLN